MPFTDAILGFVFYPALPFERISFLPHSGFAVRLFSAIRHKINETPRASLLDAGRSWIQFGSAPRAKIHAPAFVPNLRPASRQLTFGQINQSWSVPTALRD
jgi:hypothetical protein